MGDDISLKVLDILGRKCKLSDLTEKDELNPMIEECKENVKRANINTDIVDNKSFLKGVASNIKSTSILTKDNDATPLANGTNAVIPQDPPSRPQTPVFLIQPVEEHEHQKVPDYMRRYLNVSDLNNMLLSLEKAYRNRLQLSKANYNKLSKADKDIRLAMRDEIIGLKLPPETQFVSEEEWKKCLDTRMIAKIKWASQHLRHLKRIKETRFRQKIYYILL
uniref:Uncharacterized protein n=2 Tax=Panagrolaimus sp. PS1159 TaxID=55785 RepID=A0AC35EV87_9BILA